MKQAKAEREREAHLFLVYDREVVSVSGKCGTASDAIVCAAVGKENGKPKRQTRLKGDEWRTGKKMLDPTRIVLSARDGVECHERLYEKVVDEKFEMTNPNHLDMMERWLEEFSFEQSYPGAKYEIATCHDYSQEAITPSGVKDPYSWFVGRKVRKYFESTNIKKRFRIQVVEGIVEKYMKGKRLCRIRYDDGESSTDREDLD